MGDDGLASPRVRDCSLETSAVQKPPHEASSMCLSGRGKPSTKDLGFILN